MAFREIEFMDKFWSIPGGVTLIQEMMLALAYRRILSLNRIKAEKFTSMSPEQITTCNRLIRDLNHLGHLFRIYVAHGPDEPSHARRTKDVYQDYKKAVRICHRRLCGLSDEPPEDATSTTVLLRLGNNPETISQYKAQAIDLLRLYTCYIQVIQVTIQTVTHYGHPIALNPQGINKALEKLSAMSDLLQRMTIIPRDLTNERARNRDPLYNTLKKFYCLIKTFQHEPEINPNVPRPRQPVQYIPLQTHVQGLELETVSEPESEQ